METDVSWATAGRDVMRRFNDANQVGCYRTEPEGISVRRALAMVAVLAPIAAAALVVVWRVSGL